MNPVQSFAIGLLSTLIIYDLGKFVRKQLTANLKPQPESKPEDVLSLKSLGDLAMSRSIVLRENSLRIILDRAMSETHLNNIFRACASKDPTMRLKGVTAIQQLCKYEENSDTLVNKNILYILCEILKTNDAISIHRYCVVSIFRLVSMNEQRKIMALSHGILSSIMKFLSDYPTHTDDLKYWSLLLLHQLSLTESVHRQMIENGVVTLLAHTVRLTFGNTNMQKLCLHSLVRLISSMETPESKLELQKLADMNLLSLIATCLRNEDVELVSWATFLIHEFVIKDVQRERISNIRGIVKVFTGLISNDDSCIPRFVIRTLKCLSMKNELFQEKVISSDVFKRIIPCLKSNDEETRYWALTFSHDILSNLNSHQTFVQCGGLKTLVDLCMTASIHYLLYIADMFIYICNNESLNKELKESNILDAIIVFIRHEDSDVAYAGHALILNILTSHEKMIDKMLSKDMLSLISAPIQRIESSNKALCLVTAKNIITIAQKRPDVRNDIVLTTISYMITHIFSDFCILMKIIFNEENIDYIYLINLDEDEMAQDAEAIQSMDRLSIPYDVRLVPKKFLSDAEFELHLFQDRHKTKLAELDVLGTLLRTRVFEHLISICLEEESIIPMYLIGICSNLVDLLSVPLIEMGFEVEHLYDEKNGHRYMLPSSNFFTDIADYDGESTYEMMEGVRELCSMAVQCIPALFQYSMLRKQFMKCGLYNILAALLHYHSEFLNQDVMVCISLCMEQDDFPRDLQLHNKIFPKALYYASENFSPLVQFHAQSYIESLCYGIHSKKIYPSWVCDKTKLLSFSYCGWELRNDTWTFESVRCKYGKLGSGKYAYEIILKTEGIIQIGWSSDACIFDPCAGTGVGDDIHSYSYDGHRQKKWHAGLVNNDYGDPWTIGDVITCVIDLDACTISYFLNGVNMGIAFQDIDNTILWYPSFSMASGQACSVRFGGPIDQLQFKPQEVQTAFHDNFMASIPSGKLEVPPRTSSGTSDEWLFYYEVKFSSRLIPLRYQVGLTNWKATVILMTSFEDKSYIIKIKHDAHDANFLKELIIDELVYYRETHYMLETSIRSKPVRVLKEFDGTLQSGNTIGCGMTEGGILLFTVDGAELESFIVQGEDFKTFFPYVRDATDALINVGQYSFVFSQANEEACMISLSVDTIAPVDGTILNDSQTEYSPYSDARRTSTSSAASVSEASRIIDGGDFDMSGESNSTTQVTKI